MKTLKIKITDDRLGSEFPLPAYATRGSAGIDLRAMLTDGAGIYSQSIYSWQTVKISAGFSMQLELGYAGLIIPRSGLGHKGLVVGNLVGCIDSDYTGEIFISAWNRSDEPIEINLGDRIAQMLIVPVAQIDHIDVVDELDETERGDGGFNSTGVK